MKYFKKGQKVYCSLYGEGIVNEIAENSKYPVIVDFPYGHKETYTLDGKYTPTSKVVLSRTPVPEIVNVPITEFKKGQVVFVRDSPLESWTVGIFVREVEVDGSVKFVATARYPDENRVFPSWNYCTDQNPYLLEQAD